MLNLEVFFTKNIEKRWESGKTSLRNINLPPDKQFLITKNVPCPKRIKDITSHEDIITEKGFDGNWVLPNDSITSEECKKQNSKQEISEIIDVEMVHEKIQQESEELKKQLISEQPLDIDEAEKDPEPNVFSPKILNTQDTYKTRTYDISITYDFYYQTPRLWLIGYSEKGELLTKEQMFEDIYEDYAGKTVTLETHPHQGILCMSIHPCKHAELMKHIIDTLASNGKKVMVWQAMFVFLKFISSIIPTIQYDFTIDMSLK